MVIRPHQGVGPISFGMTREQVRVALSETPQPISGSQDAAPDYFTHWGLIVHYDDDGRVEAVGCGPTARIVYDGYDLFDHPAIEVRRWARAKHPNLDETEGFTSTLLGLNMSAPLIDETDLSDDERAEPAQAFVVFARGYFERGLERAVARQEARGDTRAAAILRERLARLQG